MERQRPALRKRRKAGARLYIIIGVAVLFLVAGGFFLFGKKKQSGEYYALSKRQINSALKREENQASGLRAEIIEHGMSLLGEVHYFWGGKSVALGKDAHWGEPELVTSEGSQNTGKEIPYGLDCSGFVAWCFRQTGFSEADVRNKLGLGTYHQWENSTAVNWADIQPGDLAFQNKPSAGENHVGIFIGHDEEGKMLFLHCASKFDNVVVTHQGDVFNYPRRPNLYQ
jgi:cell wall-associated NlpC family hydrolase